MKLHVVLVIYLQILQVFEVSAQQTELETDSGRIIEQYDSITFTCSYTGSGTVSVVTWRRNQIDVGPLLVEMDGSCSEFSGPIDSKLYKYTCGSGFYTWKILNVTVLEDEDKWMCRVNTGTADDSPIVELSVQVCTPITSIISNSEVNSTDRSPGTVVSVSCNEDNEVTTCLSTGRWDPEPRLQCECCCCCICCFILLIVCVALGLLFTGGHIGLTWTNHEHSVKKILFFENNETEKTNEAVYLKDYAMKVVVPECCICVLVIIIQIAVYFAALKRDCNEHCDDDCCGVVVCLVVTIIVSIVKNAIESGIIYFVVHVKGQNYTDQARHSAATNNGKVRPNDTTNDELSANL